MVYRQLGTLARGESQLEDFNLSDFLGKFFLNLYLAKKCYK